MDQNSAVIAMSGGVDSSVAACLMKERGYTCMGATMKLFQNEDLGIPSEKTCCSLDDIEDARSVAFQLDIPYQVFNFSDRFEEKVICPFIQAYENGQTPNPCIECNRSMKFDKLYSRASELGYHYVATGHYARIERDSKTGRFLLKKAIDQNKDQSYVLYMLSQEQLARTQFPLGGLTKPEVRGIAEAHGLVNARKRESQDICFVPDGKYADFIEKYTGKTWPAGDFIDQDGHVLGRHRGIIRYTIGQRKGLGLSFPQPMYVCAVDPIRNTVTLGPSEALFTDTLTVKRINLISVPSINAPLHLKAKIRYRQKEQWATVQQTDTDTLQIHFDQPQRAITKGQAAVLYDGDTVVGGGTIQ